MYGFLHYFVCLLWPQYMIVVASYLPPLRTVIQVYIFTYVLPSAKIPRIIAIDASQAVGPRPKTLIKLY